VRDSEPSAARDDASRSPSATGPLRVLQVIKSLGRGGAERLVVDLVAGGDHRAVTHEVAYVLETEDDLVADLVAHGVPVRSLGAAHNGDLAWTVALRRVLVDRRFDVVHFHLPYAAALGQLVVASLPRRHRPGVLYTEHSLWDRARPELRSLIRLSLRPGEQIVAVSQAAYDALPPVLRARARVVVHGIDIAPLADLASRRPAIRTEVRRELGVGPDEVLAVIVANLRPEKGHHVLLDAARILAERRVPVRIVSAGGGPLLDELEARRRALGLGERVAFLGGRRDATRLMAGSDIFVLASLQEGLPVTLMEATCIGLPIVATAIGGVPEVLTDGVDGLVVPPGDAPSLADALERVATDAALRQRLAAAIGAQAGRFDIAVARAQLDALYREVARR
jgi:glycosyltransferase involved in cell wall biosynthesis